jgi:hypothetical protein
MDANLPSHDAFLVDPAHAKFARGESRSLLTPKQGCMALIPVPFLLVGCVFVAVSVGLWFRFGHQILTEAELSGEYIGRELFGVFCVTGFTMVWFGFTGFVGFVLVYDLRRRWRLGRDGQRCLGEIISCTGGLSDEGNYLLEAGYRFRSPRTASWIEDEVSVTRNDLKLKRKPLPPPGTPVHIVYLTDETYMAL